MISTGSEGLFGCEVDTLLTERIHAFPEVSYVNLHIWPYNWQWATAGHLDEEFDNARQLTHEYLECHLDIAERLNKPVVVEEFGFPRDSVRFDRGTPTPSARRILYRPARPGYQLESRRRAAGRLQLLGLGRRSASGPPQLAARRRFLLRPGPRAAGLLLCLRRRHDRRTDPRRQPPSRGVRCRAKRQKPNKERPASADVRQQLPQATRPAVPIWKLRDVSFHAVRPHPARRHPSRPFDKEHNDNWVLCRASQKRDPTKRIPPTMVFCGSDYLL